MENMKHYNAFGVALGSYLILLMLAKSVKMVKFEGFLLKGSEKSDNYNEIDPKSHHIYDRVDLNKSYHDMNKNYLNYRDMYGLRYSPSRKFMKTEDHENHENQIDENKNYDSENVTNFLMTSVASIESETISPLSSLNETIMVSSLQTLKENKTTNFVSSEIAETDFDETNNHHIMKPNNRVQHALHFLTNRMKNLMYYSNDENQHKSKISPHLLTLGKFLNLFSLVRFDNVPCLTGRRPLRQLSGTCLNEIECINLGGISVDRCASGFGVCCIFKTSCGSVTNQNVTYFESPSFPLASDTNLGSCTLTILLSRDVKQVLLEFIFFEILPPTNGDCIDDQLTISTEMGSKNHQVPIVCGIATGQHMYLEVFGSEKLFISVLTHTADDRAFSIKVSQLSTYDNLAPNGCLQYHSEVFGTLESFNYDNKYSHIMKNRNPSYFNNMNYAICIKRHQNFCKISYTNEIQGYEEVFELVNVDANGNYLALGQAGAEIFSCPDDFIAVNYIRLCGYKLNDGSTSVDFKINLGVVSIMNGPIVLPVKTNNSTVGRGFRIHFFQEKC